MSSKCSSRALTQKETVSKILSRLQRAYPVVSAQPNSFQLFQLVLLHPDRSENPVATPFNLRDLISKLPHLEESNCDQRLVDDFLEQFEKVNCVKTSQAQQTYFESDWYPSTTTAIEMLGVGISISTPSTRVRTAKAPKLGTGNTKVSLTRLSREYYTGGPALHHLIWKYAEPVFLLLLHELDVLQYASEARDRSLLGIVTTRVVSQIDISREREEPTSVGVVLPGFSYLRESHEEAFHNMYGVSGLHFVVFPVETMGSNQWRVYRGIDVRDSPLDEAAGQYDSFYHAKRWFCGTGSLNYATHNAGSDGKETNRGLVTASARIASRIISPAPLRYAFKSCESGVGQPAEKCKKLIRPETCRVSFKEWCYAHLLLMFAVEAGDIPKSPDLEGEISWWFRNLYIVAKDVHLQSDTDYRVMRGFLGQAKAMGVVEGVEPVLGALQVTQDVREEIRDLKRSDIFLLEQVLKIEVRLERLRETFSRYRKYMRNSQLLGVALQIIPIVGGSVAGVVSAGAEVLEGLSAKDLTDYLLGFGCSMLLDEESSMSDGVFSRAAAALSSETLEKMETEHRLKLEEAIRCCDISTSKLRELFFKRTGKMNGTVFEQSMWSAADASQETTEVVVEEGEDEAETRTQELLYGEDDVDIPACSTGETGDPAELNSGGSPAEDSGPSAWKDFEFDREEIKKLSEGNLASLWAARVVRSDDARQKEYEELRDCFISVFRDEKLETDFIINSSEVSSEELVQVVMDRMLENGIRKAMGVRIMMRRALRQIQGED